VVTRARRPFIWDVFLLRRYAEIWKIKDLITLQRQLPTHQASRTSANVYEIVLADSIARYKRMEGFDVRFQTGTDEHGQKVEERAKSAGITPKEFVDEISGMIKGQFDCMNISYDKFIRTTDPYHEKQVQKIFKKLYDQGDIYKGHYDGLYCPECEAFYTKSQITEEGKCPVCGGELKEMQEEAYFFKMSKYADRLVKYIEDHPHFIQPESRKK